MPTAPKQPEFKQSRFILTEGTEDAAFIRAFVAARGLTGFDVRPNVDLGGIGGNSGFKNALIACEPITGFTGVSEVLILADNDDDPEKSVREICEQIIEAKREGKIKRNWGQPTNSLTKAGGDPAVSMWMWPNHGRPGCLETILWQALETIYGDVAACVQAACVCAATDGWPISKLDKARVRCFMSLVCRKNPAISLSLLWRDFPDLIPLADAAFDPIETFLHAI
jgi:Protein of unknown function (DUF3226)